MKLFLKQQGWKLGNVQNGNCPFQALSFAIHQHQDMHNKQLIKNNKQKFKPFIIGSVLIAHHQHVKKLGTWGTQVELIATLEKILTYCS